jgi:type I restriction-modification system DNA methylase subunit
MTQSHRELISVGEIAEIAGVGSSAVSNWRLRHLDFPQPVEPSPAGDLFDLKSIRDWLREHEKELKSRPSAVRSAWAIAESFRRGGLSIDQSIQLLLQLMYFRYRSQQPSGDPVRLGQPWTEFSTVAGSIYRTWRAAVQVLSIDVPELERVLAPTTSIREDVVRDGILRLNVIDLTPTDYGKLATALLTRFSEVSATGAHGAATPEGVSKLIVQLLDPVEGVVYDPAAGVAMILAEAWRRRESDDLTLRGQEINEASWRLGFLHLSLNGARFELQLGDTLRHDQYRELRADRVVADPPLGGRFHDVFFDERFGYGMPGASEDWLWVQHVAFHLARNGAGTITITPSALERRGKEATIRARMIDDDLIDAVIDLPPGVFPGSKVPLALLVLARDRGPRRGRILFINARQIGRPRRGHSHSLGHGGIEHIVATVRKWRLASFEDSPPFAASASAREILERESDLSPKRYVSYAAPLTELEGKPIPMHYEKVAGDVRSALSNAPDTVEVALNAFEASTLHHFPLVRLADVLIAAPQTGTRQSDPGSQPKVPFVATTAITSSRGRLTEPPNVFSALTVKATERQTRLNDILLAARGIDEASRIGCAIVQFDEPAAFAESLIRLSPNERLIDPNYLRYWLSSRQARRALAAATTGSVIGNLRPDALIEIQLPLPDLESQRTFVSGLASMESAVLATERLAHDVAALFDTVREGVTAGQIAPRNPVTKAHQTPGRRIILD